MRTLWLVFERPPHPDAVSFPAGEADVRFAMVLLGRPYANRCDLAVQLRNFLAGESTRSPFDRRLVPIRHGDDGCRLVPWRFAKWLGRVLPAEDGIAAKERFDREKNKILQDEHVHERGDEALRDLEQLRRAFPDPESALADARKELKRVDPRDRTPEKQAELAAAIDAARARNDAERESFRSKVNRIDS